MITSNIQQDTAFGAKIEFGSADMYDLDLQINEEALKGPVPQRSFNCTLKQCRTQNNSSDCTSCWNSCK